MAGVLTILEDQDQLRALADVIYRREVNAISEINFPSEPDLAKYLAECKANHTAILGLLDAASNLKSKFKDRAEDPRATIALDVYTYVARSLNAALQTVKKYSSRAGYLDEVGEHARDLIKAVEELDPLNVAEVERLAGDAVQYKNAMLNHLNNYQTAAADFSKGSKESGTKLETNPAVQSNKGPDFKFLGRLEELEDQKKPKAYGRTMTMPDGSWRGRVIVKVVAATGIAVLLFTGGRMLDVISSTHSWLTIFVMVALAFLLLDFMIRSRSRRSVQPLSTQGFLRSHTAAEPDGPVLARQIAHHNKFGN